MLNNLLKLSAFIFTISFLSFQGNSIAQLSGLKSIPGDYATIEAAITDLNLQGVGSGGVTFNVNAGHTETFSAPVAGLISASGTLTDQIIFQKSGVGNNPLITAALNGTGTTDGIIIITGGDYITFDAIDLQENSGNINSTTQMEWGYALVKRNATAPVDGCQYVTIQNCNISLNSSNTSASGIYSGNHLATSTSFLTLSDQSDAMNNCLFNANDISDVYSGIILKGSTNSEYYDSTNTVSGNNISNFGGGSSSAYGTNIEYQKEFLIEHNTIGPNNSGQTGVLYGLRTGSANNSNVIIRFNTVHDLTQGGTSLIYALTNSMGSLGVDNVVTIHDNEVFDCSQPNSTSNSVWLIYNLARARLVNIYSNTIRGNTKTAGTGPMHCIYHSPTSTHDELNIYDNSISDNASNGPIYGIHITNGTVANIYNNEIFDLRTTSGTNYVAGIRVASGPTEVNIYNNFISDLKANVSGDDDAIRGIDLSSTTSNSNLGLYYNTIFLNSSGGGGNFGSAGIYHSANSTATTAALDMRNNIVVNLSNSFGTGKTAAFRRSSSVGLDNYSNLSNNNCFYAGIPAANKVIFYDGTNFDQTLEDFKIRVAPRETNSVTENVPFINSTTAPYDLHVSETLPTQTESGATPITTPVAITTDFDGDTRSVTTPDMGADEFDGNGIDITAPSIIYTVLDPTTSTANRTLSNVDITDQSGVNVTSGTAPRIYYKRSTDNNTYIDNTSSSNGWKYTETSNTSSPFNFLIDYSLLFGGTGVQMGDFIQYFVVAQDVSSPVNVGINSGTFNSPPASVNLTSAAFPLTGTINSYYIITTLNGIVTVGTGGDYATITGPNGLFETFNGNIVTGNVTAEIISDITETGDVSLTEWVEQGAGNYTLTIQPNSAVVRTISGPYADGLIRLEGADRVIFDGRFNGSGNYLTFENTLAASNTAAFRFLSLGAIGQGCTDITIRNCNIKGGANNLSNIFGIFLGSSTGSLSTGNAGGVDYDNISILENNIWNCRTGIFARGTSTIPFPDQMQNFVVSGNAIGHDNSAESVTEYGMYIGYVDAPQVTFNEVYNMNYDVSKRGIYFVQNVNNAIVSKNKIHSIKQPGTTGYNSVGIWFDQESGCFDNQIDNNMIYDLSTWGNTSMYLVGIRIDGGSGYKVYFNSISINDTLGNTATNLVSSCLYFSIVTTNADVRNNIFFNTRTGNSPKNYAVFTPNTSTFTSIDYNDYWTTGSVIGYFGGDIANFTDWKNATGQDANSISGDPDFISPTDLHINPTSSTVSGEGIYLATVTTDIDGDTRLDPPDLGADEYGASSTFQLTVNVLDGWNMVSVPGVNPDGQGVAQWWPGRTGDVFGYNSGYVIVTNTTPGDGYWMKNVGAQTYNTGDEWPAGGIQFVAHDPIPGNAGWNLIGGYENTATVANITTNPSGLQEGPVYGFNGGYTTPATMEAGYGYWIKLSGAGDIILPNALAKGTEPVEWFKEDWGRIVVTDATGKKFTLYAVNGEVNLDQYEMPPLPPQGMFDIRYNSGRIAEDINSSVQAIDMTGVVYPLTVRAENMAMRLQDETGKKLNENVKDGEEIVINDSQINKLMVSGELLPTVYALEQNYPNPFNPSTTIEFSLPEEVKNVKLSIYSILGEKVAELVNTSLIAGNYKFQWNAQNVATGMYIYELRTDKFVSVKKMMLLK